MRTSTSSCKRKGAKGAGSLDEDDLGQSVIGPLEGRQGTARESSDLAPVLVRFKRSTGVVGPVVRVFSRPDPFTVTVEEGKPGGELRYERMLIDLVRWEESGSSYRTMNRLHELATKNPDLYGVYSNISVAAIDHHRGISMSSQPPELIAYSDSEGGHHVVVTPWAPAPFPEFYAYLQRADVPRIESFPRLNTDS